MEELKALDKNIKGEYAKIDGAVQKDKDGFYKKVAFLKKTIPPMQAIWQKLGMDLSESEPVFTKINGNLKSYENKEELEMKKVSES